MLARDNSGCEKGMTLYEALELLHHIVSVRMNLLINSSVDYTGLFGREYILKAND